MKITIPNDEMDVLKGFIEESGEHLSGIEDSLLKLETDDDPELVNNIFRMMHSVKGAAGFLGLNEIRNLSHCLEDLMNDIRSHVIPCTSDVVDVLLDGGDAMCRMIQAMKMAADAAEPGKEETELTVEDIPFKPVLERVRKLREAPPPKAKPPIPSAIPIPPSLKKDFCQEAEEQLDKVEEVLLAIESDPTQIDLYHQLFRSLHTVKGNAGVVISTVGDEQAREGHILNYFKKLAHASETLIQQKRDKKFPLAGKEVDLLLSCLDALKSMVREFKQDKKRSFDPAPLIAELESGIGAKAVETRATTATPDVGGVSFAISNTMSQCMEAIDAGIEEIKDDSRRDKALKKIDRSFKTMLRLGKKISHVLLVKESGNALKILEFLKAGKDENEGLLIESLASKLEAIREKGDRRKAVAAPPEPQIHREEEARVATQVVKVPMERLDKIMNLVGELVIGKNNFALMAREISTDHNLPALARKVKDAGDTVGRISDELQNTVMAARMIPVGAVFSRFPRMVRDLSKKLGKKIALELQGEETELDKTVIEGIGDPLVHLVRNSLDHGLETPEERTKAQKPETGRIILKAYNKGQSAIIEIIDDGRGIDPRIIREKAVEKGVGTKEELERMDDIAVQNLIFHPGFSCAKEVTEISGRGVGMDVVKNNIEKLGGNVILESLLGGGTRVLLKLPLTLAVNRGLEVESDGDHYFIPLDCVRETVRVDPKNIHQHKDREMVVARGDLLPLSRLGGLLSVDSQQDARSTGGHNNAELSLITLDIEGRTAALMVDKVIGESEFVIKPLQGDLGMIPGFSGATITGDGKVILVLDPGKLI